MKNDLKKHITNIFASLQITSPFEVYECNDVNLPKWAKQVQFTHDFLVCCEKVTETKKLQAFLGKNIFELGSYVYWFEGNRIKAQEQTEIEELGEITEQGVDCLKTKTRLPAWLDDYIFNILKAEYAPDFQRFDYNLDLTEEGNLKYLGTYFPRSYAESFCIFDNIFQNIKFQKAVFQKECFNILSVGCGTGGDLIGLLAVIEKYCTKNTTLNIWAIDGNKNALDILTRIVEMFKTTTSRKLNLNVLQFVFSTDTGQYIAKDEIKAQEFDFVLSFKMITEIISAGKGNADNSYFHFLKTFVPLLSDNGLCVLLDVTTKQEHNNTYNPILMNDQINKALRELKNYKTLLPLSCNLHEANCAAICFTQQQFVVSHSKRANDISKVAYRIITKVNLAEQLGQPDAKAKHLIGKNNICCHTENNDKKIDSYLLEKQLKIKYYG